MARPSFFRAACRTLRSTARTARPLRRRAGALPPPGAAPPRAARAAPRARGAAPRPRRADARDVPPRPASARISSSSRRAELVGARGAAARARRAARAASVRRAAAGRCACGAPCRGSHFCANCGRLAGEPVVACTELRTRARRRREFCAACGAVDGAERVTTGGGTARAAAPPTSRARSTAWSAGCGCRTRRRRRQRRGVLARRVGRYRGDWIWPVLGVLLVVAAWRGRGDPARRGGGEHERRTSHVDRTGPQSSPTPPRPQTATRRRPTASTRRPADHGPPTDPGRLRARRRSSSTWPQPGRLHGRARSRSRRTAAAAVAIAKARQALAARPAAGRRPRLGELLEPPPRLLRRLQRRLRRSSAARRSGHLRADGGFRRVYAGRVTHCTRRCSAAATGYVHLRPWQRPEGADFVTRR